MREDSSLTRPKILRSRLSEEARVDHMEVKGQEHIKVVLEICPDRLGRVQASRRLALLLIRHKRVVTGQAVSIKGIWHVG